MSHTAKVVWGYLADGIIREVEVESVPVGHDCPDGYCAACAGAWQARCAGCGEVMWCPPYATCTACDCNEELFWVVSRGRRMVRARTRTEALALGVIEPRAVPLPNDPK